MVLWIGVDDTDSLQGMCTTFLGTELVRDLTRDYDLIGYPRLVRLNPNVPWKTRGNAAICVRVGKGRGTSRVVGLIDGQEVVAFPQGGPGTEPSAIVDRIADVVELWSKFEDPTTNPGFAVLRRPAPACLYWRGVRGFLSKAEVLRSVRDLGIVRGYKNGRGVIGALAATAWRPQDRTYEVLAYRDRSDWGRFRGIDPLSVMEMDRAFPSTFNNYDYENDRMVITPHSPCPVLFGIRGDDPVDLRPAMMTVRGESPDRWLIFETNQGTDDHVSSRGVPAPGMSVQVRRTVSAPPVVLPGGHVCIRLGPMEATAYEPSKQFRQAVRMLIPGDVLEVVGSVRDRPRTINLEKFRVIALAPRFRKIANPFCESCGKHAKSLGRDAPFRCVRCRKRFSRNAAPVVRMKRDLKEGWYEPPVGSRRHLAKPVKRMKSLPDPHLIPAKPFVG